ncbi:MAG: hypothetical protein OCC46_10400 [Pseudodesulfovibrio sp.]
MGAGRGTTILRLAKPIVAGLALAYIVTAFVDKPAPVHFQPENPYAAKQEEIAEPKDDLVVEKNIMKLGSPLSVTPDEGVENNPLALLEDMADADANATAVRYAADDNATGVRVEVEEMPVEQVESSVKQVEPIESAEPAETTEPTEPPAQ